MCGSEGGLNGAKWPVWSVKKWRGVEFCSGETDFVIRIGEVSLYGERRTQYQL
jgi:hypothetical protein